MPPPPTPGTPIARYRDGKKNRPKSVGMLIEGDSWFAYPMWLSTNIVAELKNTYQDKIVQLDLSWSGDEAREMLCGSQFAKLYQVLAQEKLQFDCILFSGGGNDLVSTNLPVLLRSYENGATWEDCLNMSRFNRRLEEIENAYHDLADLRDDYQPDAWVFTQAYDYAIPNGKGVRILGIEAAGGWLKEVMDARGIPPEIQQELMDHILSRFDDLMIRLSQTNDKWVHVRTQGTLADSEWANELHPTTEGFKKITAKFQAALGEVFPKLRV
jgi:hypothetical protein